MEQSSAVGECEREWPAVRCVRVCVAEGKRITAANQDSHETGRHRGQEVKGERGCKLGGDGNLQGGLGQQQPVGLCSLCWRSQVQKGLCVCPVLGGQTGEATSADVYTLNLPAACEDHILTVWGQRRAGWENQWDGEKEERQIIDKEECWVKEKMKDWSCRLSDVRQDCRVSSPVIKKKRTKHALHSHVHTCVGHEQKRTHKNACNGTMSKKEGFVIQ